MDALVAEARAIAVLWTACHTFTLNAASVISNFGPFPVALGEPTKDSETTIASMMGTSFTVPPSLRQRG